MRVSAVLLAGSVLLACGGGGAAEMPAQSAQGVQAPQILRIAAFGDSTQQGSAFVSSEVGYRAAISPAAEAQRQLRAWTGRDDIEVDNHGIGGTSSAQMLTGADGSGMSWADRLEASGASIVTINHGINDNGRADADFRVSLRELVHIAQAAGKRVVLETPNPLVAGGVVQVQAGFNLADHLAKVQAVRDVSAETGAVLCDQHKAIVDAGLATMEFLPDGVHPAPGLYLFKGRTLGACLLPLVAGH